MRYMVLTTLVTLVPLLGITDFMASMALASYSVDIHRPLTLKDVWRSQAISIYLIGSFITLGVVHSALDYDLTETTMFCSLVLCSGLALRQSCEDTVDDVRISFTMCTTSVFGFFLAFICIASGHFTIF